MATRSNQIIATVGLGDPTEFDLYQPGITGGGEIPSGYSWSGKATQLQILTNSRGINAIDLFVEDTLGNVYPVLEEVRFSKGDSPLDVVPLLGYTGGIDVSFSSILRVRIKYPQNLQANDWITLVGFATETGYGEIPGLGTLGVASGGTGKNALPANGLLIGNGTNAIESLMPGTDGQIIVSQNGDWVVGSNSGSGGSSTLAWGDITGKPSFASVATSGSYDDLINKPSLFDGTYASLTGKPSLFSGSYDDLTGKPSLFSGSYLDLSNIPSTFPSDWASVANKPTFFDGNYANLTNAPTLFDGQYSSLSGKPTLFDGNYASLAGKPTLFSGSYADLTDKLLVVSATEPASPVNGMIWVEEGGVYDATWHRRNNRWESTPLYLRASSTGTVTGSGTQTLWGDKRFNIVLQYVNFQGWLEAGTLDATNNWQLQLQTINTARSASTFYSFPAMVSLDSNNQITTYAEGIDCDWKNISGAVALAYRIGKNGSGANLSSWYILEFMYRLIRP